MNSNKQSNDEKQENLTIWGATLNKDHEALKILLSNDDLSTINKEYFAESPLDVAIMNNDEISVELLLNYGAIPDYERPEHIWAQSALSRAITIRNLKIIRLLINHGCDPDTIIQMSDRQKIALHPCPHNYWYKIVKLDNLDIFKLLLELKNRNVCNDEWSQKMLMAACCLKSNTMIEYFLNQGVSIESVDEKGWTCLFYAVAHRLTSVTMMLLKRGANIKHKDLEGRSILHIAVLQYPISRINLTSPYKIVVLLIKFGAEINSTDNKGLTPINAALTMENIDADVLFQFLRLKNVDHSKPDINGVTVLHRLITINYKSLYHYLLMTFNGDINAKDKEGKRPLECMKYNDNISSSNLAVMLEFGAKTDDLHHFKDKLLGNANCLSVLVSYRLKRKAANFSDDPNIDEVLAYCKCSSEHWCKNYVSMLEEEIQLMKNKILCDKMTYYDFLHAKKRTCINVAKKPVMHKIFIKRGHKLKHYTNMLAKNYLSGVRSLTRIESEAVNSVEENLDVIFNGKLPNLVVYNIKKYLDIEDMVTLKNLKLLDTTSNEN